MAPPQTQPDAPAARLLAFEGTLLNGTRKTFDRQWNPKAPMSLTELVSLVKKKTNSTQDGSISVGLVFERQNGDAFVLDDDDDVGGMYLRLETSTYNETNVIRFTLRQEAIVLGSSSPAGAATSHNPAQVSRPNQKVSGSSKTREKTAEPAAAAEPDAAPRRPPRPSAGASKRITASAPKSAKQQTLHDLDDSADELSVGQGATNGEREPGSIEEVDRALRGFPGPMARLPRVSEPEEEEDEEDGEDGEDEDDSVEGGDGPTGSDTEEDARPVKKAKRNGPNKKQALTPTRTSRRNQPVAKTQIRTAAASTPTKPSGESSSSTTRPTRKVAPDLQSSSAPAANGNKRKKAPAASTSASGSVQLASEKLSYVLGPNGIPVKRGPGRARRDAVLMTEADAKRILAKSDKPRRAPKVDDKTKKHIKAIAKASSKMLMSRADLLGTVVLKTLKSLSTDTGESMLDRETLVNLALVCKGTLKNAGRWLYSSVDLDSLDDWELVFGHQTPPELVAYLGRDHIQSATLSLPSSDLDACAEHAVCLAPYQFAAPRLSAVKIVLAVPDQDAPDGSFDVGHHRVDLHTLVRSVHSLISSQLQARPTLLADLAGKEDDCPPWLEIVCEAATQEDAVAESGLVLELMDEVWEDVQLEDAKGKGKARAANDDWMAQQAHVWGVAAEVAEGAESEEESDEEVQGSSEEDSEEGEAEEDEDVVMDDQVDQIDDDEAGPTRNGIHNAREPSVEF